MIQVVIVGGSMRIPRVQRLLEVELLQHGAVLRKTLDMDRGLFRLYVLLRSIKVH